MNGYMERHKMNLSLVSQTQSLFLDSTEGAQFAPSVGKIGGEKISHLPLISSWLTLILHSSCPSQPTMHQVSVSPLQWMAKTKLGWWDVQANAAKTTTSVKNNPITT